MDPRRRNYDLYNFNLPPLSTPLSGFSFRSFFVLKKYLAKATKCYTEGDREKGSRYLDSAIEIAEIHNNVIPREEIIAIINAGQAAPETAKHAGIHPREAVAPEVKVDETVRQTHHLYMQLLLLKLQIEMLQEQVQEQVRSAMETPQPQFEAPLAA